MSKLLHDNMQLPTFKFGNNSTNHMLFYNTDDFSPPPISDPNSPSGKASYLFEVATILTL